VRGLLSKYPLIANVLPPRRSRPPRAWRAAARTLVRRVVRTKDRGGEKARKKERGGGGGERGARERERNDTIKASEFYLRRHLG
jgi:hypothetical protein